MLYHMCKVQTSKRKSKKKRMEKEEEMERQKGVVCRVGGGDQAPCSIYSRVDGRHRLLVKMNKESAAKFLELNVKGVKKTVHGQGCLQQPGGVNIYFIQVLQELVSNVECASHMMLGSEMCAKSYISAHRSNHITQMLKSFFSFIPFSSSKLPLIGLFSVNRGNCFKK